MNRTAAEIIAQEIALEVPVYAEISDRHKPAKSFMEIVRRVADIIERTCGQDQTCPECGSEERRRWNIANCTCPKVSKKNPDPRHLATCYCKNKWHSEAEERSCIARKTWQEKYGNCTMCDIGDRPEWSPFAKCFIHRHERLDRRCGNNPASEERSCGETAWVSVDDDMPKSGTDTLIYFHAGIGWHMRISYFLMGQWYQDAPYSVNHSGVTHWAKLPSPPTGRTEEK